MFDNDKASDDDIWDDETGETVGAARARFETFGPLVAPEDVPALVRAGADVMSFGYGDDPKAFDAIDSGDLWAFGFPEVGDPVEPDPELVAQWAPFRQWVVERDPYDEYGTVEHEAVLMAEERGQAW